MKKYTSESEILALVHDFENGTISRDKWKHAEHLTVAFHYISQHDLETATDKMRGGIFNLLESFGVNLSKEMPYHKTLTCFWMQTIDKFARSNSSNLMIEAYNQLIERFDKNLPLKFYSRELLFSDRARAEFVEPDLQDF